MKTLLRSPIGSLLVASLLVIHAAAQDPTPPAPAAKTISDLRAQALSAIQKGESDTANQSADDMLRMYPNDARAMRLAGDIFLRTGKVASHGHHWDTVAASHRRPGWLYRFRLFESPLALGTAGPKSISLLEGWDLAQHRKPPRN